MTIWPLIPLITCLTYILLFALTLQSIEKRINKIFALYLGVAAVWSFTSFMLHLNALPQQALFWNELLIAALVWTLITYYHFIRTYTNKPSGMGVYLGYAVVLVLAALCFSGRIVQYAYIVDGVLHHSLGISIYFIGAISFAFTGASIVLLVKKYRSSTDPTDRNRTAYLMIGWSILVPLSYSNLIPAVAGLPLAHIGNLANTLIIAYTIRKYHLLAIRFVLRRGLAYLIFASALLGIYIGSILIWHKFFPDLPLYSVLLLASGLAFLLALLARPLRYFIQERIDRLFYRGTYDYRQMLLNFSTKVSNVLDLGELAQSMLDLVVKTMHVKQAALLFSEIEGGYFNTRFVQQTTEEEPFAKLRLANDNPVVTWLATEGKVFQREFIDAIPQFKGLWEVERIALNALGVELLCPIRSKGSLIGILALGKKQSDSPYSDEETDLLMTMANEVAIAVENASMLDSLKSQQLQVEQLLAQVVLAQEEERKRISIDLHDSVAQWLVATSYRMQTLSHGLSGDEGTNTRGELAGMESTITKSLQELRRVVVGLRPPDLNELGLTHALQQSLDDLRTSGLDCKFSQVGTPIRLPSSMEITAYRVVQEALTNIRKHANATKINLRLQFQKDKLLVEIHDNGQGFDRSQTLGSAISVGHMGLLGMKQRAEMLGGDIKIKTDEGKGTTIILSLPSHSSPKRRDKWTPSGYF